MIKLCQCEACQYERTLDRFLTGQTQDIQWPVVIKGYVEDWKWEDGDLVFTSIAPPPPTSFLHRVAFRISDLGSYLNSEWLWAKGGAFEYYLDERWHARQKTRRPIIMRDKLGEQYFVQRTKWWHEHVIDGTWTLVGICIFILSAMVVYRIGLDY